MQLDMLSLLYLTLEESFIYQNSFSRVINQFSFLGVHLLRILSCGSNIINLEYLYKLLY